MHILSIFVHRICIFFLAYVCILWAYILHILHAEVCVMAYFMHFVYVTALLVCILKVCISHLFLHIFCIFSAYLVHIFAFLAYLSIYSNIIIILCNVHIYRYLLHILAYHCLYMHIPVLQVLCRVCTGQLSPVLRLFCSVLVPHHIKSVISQFIASKHTHQWVSAPARAARPQVRQALGSCLPRDWSSGPISWENSCHQLQHVGRSVYYESLTKQKMKNLNICKLCLHLQ